MHFSESLRQVAPNPRDARDAEEDMAASGLRDAAKVAQRLPALQEAGAIAYEVLSKFLQSRPETLAEILKAIEPVPEGTP